MNNINPIVYIIQPGDTLYNIAIRFGTTVQNLINMNLDLEPYNLRVGQRIYIYPNNQVMNNCISQNQVQLINEMNLVWEQHIMWTRMLLISIAECLKDLDATQTRLLRNPGDIANIFKRYYGDNISNEIQKLLTEHLVIGKNLIVALKNKNQDQASKLNSEWYNNADKMTEFFSSINPYYNKEELQKMFYEHLRLTSIEVSSRLEGNYEKDINAYDMVQQEILKMSQFFVNGIVKQFCL